MKIVINPFSVKSIDAAIDRVNQYKKDFEGKLEEFTRRLAEIGVTLAEVGYATSYATGVDYSEASSIVVSLQKNDNGYSVLAQGEAVGFLEFGTGRPERNPEWNSAGMEYTPPARGSYGKHQGLNEWGWWFNPHDGGAAQHTYGNPPTEAMRFARDEMIANVARIAREVWR